MSDDYRQKLKSFSERMVTVAPRCTNEEATKMFLILPFLTFLGYDTMNPDEVCPEHNADFSDKYKNKVDFAVLKSTHPVIAVECKSVGSPLKDDRGQLRSYFNAAPTVKMGVLADGLIYEFYADSDEPNMMDIKAFLSFDLREVAKGKIEDSIVDGLKSLHKDIFDPDNIGAEAKRKLVFQNLVQQISALSTNPSEAFVRLLLQNIGLMHIRAKAMSDYVSLTKDAFGEFVNIRILQRLDLPAKDKEADKPVQVIEISKIEIDTKPDSGVVTTDLEVYVYEYTKRRLAFLVNTDELYDSIDDIEYRDYKGKFVVFFKKERSGRLYDFYENKENKYTFDFGSETGGEISTNDLSVIDSVLMDIFSKRVGALGTSAKKLKQKENRTE